MTQPEARLRPPKRATLGVGIGRKSREIETRRRTFVTGQNGAWPGHGSQLVWVFHRAMAAEKPSGSCKKTLNHLSIAAASERDHDCEVRITTKQKLYSSSASQRQSQRQSQSQSQKHRQKSSRAAVGIIAQRRYDVSGPSGWPCCKAPYSKSNVRRPENARLTHKSRRAKSAGSWAGDWPALIIIGGSEGDRATTDSIKNSPGVGRCNTSE